MKTSSKAVAALLTTNVLMHRTTNNLRCRKLTNNPKMIRLKKLETNRVIYKIILATYEIWSERLKSSSKNWRKSGWEYKSSRKWARVNRTMGQSRKILQLARIRTAHRMPPTKNVTTPVTLIHLNLMAQVMLSQTTVSQSSKKFSL